MFAIEPDSRATVRPLRVELTGTPSGPGTVDASVVAEDVLFLPGVFPWLAEVARFVQNRPSLLSSSTVARKADAYSDATHRSSSHASLTDSPVPELATFSRKLKLHEGALLRVYASEVNRHADVESGSGHDLLRYGEHEHFAEHVDAVRGSPDPVLYGRWLSAVYFCNQGYSGGDLVFPRQGIRFRPRAGSAILFPSGMTHPHAVESVEGTVPRWTVTAWYF